MDKVQEIIIENEEDTREFGHQLASHLEPGSVVALFGDLGTGKTTLTKYIGQGLGVEEIITSPTFTVIQEYRNGRIPLYHFDVYRLNGPQDLLDLGYEDYFYGFRPYFKYASALLEISASTFSAASLFSALTEI